MVRRRPTALQWKEAAEKYSTLVNNTSEGIWIHDLGGEILEVNNAYCRMSGYSREELLHMPIGNLEAADAPAHMSGFIRKLIELSGQGRFESQHRRKDGTTFDAEVTALCLGKEDGRIAVFVRDITGRKWTEAKLRAVEDRYKGTFKFAPVAIFEIAFDGGSFFRVNDMVCKMTGFTREELLSMKPLDLTDDEGKARFTERMRLRLADEEVSDAFEMRIRTKGGAYLDMLICPGDFIYADGMRTGALVIAHDITEFKRIEKELRKKENHLRSIIQYAPTGIYEIDYSTGRFIDVNDVMSDMLGYSREEYLAMAVSDILDEADKPLYAARMSDVNAGKELEKCLEYRLRAKDGRLFWVIINLTYRWKDGKIVGATGVATDISGRKLIENELLALNRRLRTLMDCAPVGISFSSDATCEHIRGNAAMLAQFEMSPRENVSASAPDGDAAGRKVKYYKDGRELSDADLPLQRAVAENRAIPSKDLEIVLPSGRRWFADAFGAPILDSNGVVVGGVAVTVDITQRKLAEQALAETSQKLAEVISSIQDEFFVLDRNWIFVYVNRKFTLKFGKEPMDFLGNNVWKILPRHRGTPIEENLRATMEKREVRRFEIQGVYTDAWFRITSFPSAEGITVIGTDITERKRTEEELGKRMNELAATNEELARFNSAMVHRELRMVELKKQVNELSRRLGEPPVYNLENP